MKKHYTKYNPDFFLSKTVTYHNRQRYQRAFFIQGIQILNEVSFSTCQSQSLKTKVHINMHLSMFSLSREWEGGGRITPENTILKILSLIPYP